MGLNIRQRLMLTFTLVISVGSLLLFWVAGRQIETATVEFHRSDLTNQALTISGVLLEDLEHYLEGEDGQNNASLQQLIERMALSEGQHITILDTNRRILADNQAPTLLFAQLPDTPEVSA